MISGLMNAIPSFLEIRDYYTYLIFDIFAAQIIGMMPITPEGWGAFNNADRMNNRQPEIYFHVGLERTATTFLQQKVFPKLTATTYVPKSKYWEFDSIVAANGSGKYLVSHEFSRRLYDEIEKFSAKYPNARIILVLRRQDRWLASQYKRSVKNGNSGQFREFFDADFDTGRWKKEEMFYFPKIRYIEEKFRNKPLILFHEDLKENPSRFLQQLLAFTKTSASESVSFAPRHTSYGDKELKVRKWFTENTRLRDIPAKHRKYRKLRIFYNKTIRYVLIYLAKLIPESLVSDEPLIPNTEKQKIANLYSKDWERCITYANHNNPQIWNYNFQTAKTGSIPMENDGRGS